MQKKSLFTMLIALCLVGAVMVGATVAYLSDSTDTLNNVFTVGNVEIEIDEPDWDEENAKNLEYGAEIAKDPQITNTGKNDAFVVMEVTGMNNMSQNGFSVDFDTNNWVRIDTNGEIASDNTLVDGFYMYKSLVAVNDVTAPLFEKVVFEGEEVQGEVEFTLSVKGYAIQTSQMGVVVGEEETDTPDAKKVYAGLFE